MHYTRWRRYGDFATVKKPGNPRGLGDCGIDDGNGPCGRPAVAQNLCGKHYQRWTKWGDPTVTKLDRDRTPEERFWPRVDKNGPPPPGDPEMGPCWLWTGGTSEGYGMFSLAGKQVKAHRRAYIWLVGEIPEDLQLDHVCHSVSTAICAGGEDCMHRRCVNPAHLEPVTGLVNFLRGLSPHAINAAKTHCPQNHEYDEENTYQYQGQRRCRECARQRCLEWYYRQKDGGPGDGDNGSDAGLPPARGCP
jgi:hypothetical protein